MQNSHLYTNLIDATKRIVAQFGSSIVHEERFVNILSDLYPERDNPAVLRIIKSAIQDDLLKIILSANVQNIKLQVSTVTSTLSTLYGYDHTLVENILFSLAVGYSTISVEEYNTINNPQSKPVQKKQTPNKPTPNKQQKKPQPSQDSFSIRDLLILLWGMLGLLVSPVFYGYQVSGNEWMPIGASIVTAIIQYLTIFPVSMTFDNDTSLSGRRVHPALHGGYCALYIFAILFWIAFPVIWSIRDLQAHWKFLPNSEAFPWLAWIVNLFCALILSTALGQGVSKYSKNWRQNKGKFEDNFRDLMTEQPYRNGFFAVSAFFVLAAFVLFIIPSLRESQYKSRIDEFNDKIEKINLHSDSIKSTRSQTERDLSFAIFNLGDSYSSCISKIDSNDEYTSFSKNTYKDELTINETDYISIVDTILHVKTNWNNEDITVDIYFAKQNLIAIQFSPEKTNGDSILASYASKYGEPETHLKKIDKPEHVSSYDYDLGYSIMENKIVPEHFFWTYKNALLKIDYRPGTHYYSSSYSSLNEGALITYFDRKADVLLKQDKEERTRKAREYEKRRKDSLRLVREAEERQQQEQRRQEELNHKRSMEQI